MFPDPEECDECWRPTFLPTGWDMFGATNTTGQCIACGYIRTGDEALDLAIEEAFDRAMDRPDCAFVHATSNMAPGPGEALVKGWVRLIRPSA